MLQKTICFEDSSNWCFGESCRLYNAKSGLCELVNKKPIVEEFRENQAGQLMRYWDGVRVSRLKRLKIEKKKLPTIADVEAHRARDRMKVRREALIKGEAS